MEKYLFVFLFRYFLLDCPNSFIFLGFLIDEIGVMRLVT